MCALVTGVQTCALPISTGELPLPLAVLHRGSAVRRGRTAPGRRQGRRGANRAHGRRCAEELTMSQDDAPDLAAPHADKVAPEAVALRAQPRPVTRLGSEERRLGKEGVSTCRYRWSPSHDKKQHNKTTTL